MLLENQKQFKNDEYYQVDGITAEEYNDILSIIQNKPEDTDTIIYKLHSDTLEYVAYDRPEEPVIEPTDPVIDSIISEVASNGY